ncbi:hypothetical protein F5888DRAFT_1794721 [Russula emetica]|nr:hypothetical protein F5888DRAFT_1794721 [Russula emetica]
MFKKPLGDTKTSAPLRSSERRKLRARTAERFQLAPEVADNLVPDGLLSQKFSAYNGEPGVLYLSGDGNPLWFSAGKGSDELIPTVYTLWKHPTLLPILTTPASVIPVLVGGADLMVPGVVQAPADAPSGTLVGIARFVRDARGPPLAVGRMAVDADKIDHGVTKGKAVIVLHTWKDHLWATGSKGEPPEAVVVSAHGDEETVASDDDKDAGPDGGEGADALTGAGQEPVVGDGPVSGPEEEKLTPEEVSARLRAALLQALRTTLADLPSSAFPMPTTTTYTAHILRARAFTRTATTPVDIKHSTFKSLSAFLRAAEKGGLLKLKDARPDVVVVAVYPKHRRLGEEESRRRLAEEREAQQATAAANAEKSMKVTELWKPHLGTLRLFEDLGHDTSALYTLAEVKSALLAYVAKHELANRVEQQYLNVSSDAIFSVALYGSPNAKGAGAVSIPEFAKREDALSALCGRMQPWYRIAIGSDESFTKKGTLRPIIVAAKTRQGRKVCTFITGFEQYHLSGDALAEALRVRCASSTSVSPIAGGLHEVMVQGKQTPAVLELLGSLGVPEKWIEVTNIVGKKK